MRGEKEEKETMPKMAMTMTMEVVLKERGATPGEEMAFFSARHYVRVVLRETPPTLFP